MFIFIWVTLSLQGPERQKVILVAAGGAVAICGVTLVMLAVLFQRPLEELHQKIAQLRDGDLNVTASFAGRNDEIGDLGRNFNEMVRQLRESREKLHEAHRTQMSRAEHLATLGELAAGLAHEIRNPLAGIAGVIEVIGRDLPENSPAREVWKEVQQEMRHIQRILNDLLDYARPRLPDIRPADLNTTAEHAVKLARQQVLSRPIEIDLITAPDLPPVEHDSGQMQQVLLNLLLNAIQAIESSGRIDLQLQSRDNCAVVTVTDTGRGIDPGQLPNIFRPFFTTKGKGTGLGLSLAQRIVQAHNGRIEVASTRGTGTRFSVWLPLRKPEPVAAYSK
ncbi:MAG: HAMP domain-containing protein [Acidobacteria bacterium]|nr:HAMP domain-containing protein [Acidobacteriota bacterium]